jgi:hypothetical protein
VSSLCTFPFGAWLRIALVLKGFPEFTRFFPFAPLGITVRRSVYTLRFLARAANLGMNLSVAIRTKQDTLIQFFLNSLPTPGITFRRNAEILLRRNGVMEFQSFQTSNVSTSFAPTAFIFKSHFSYLSSSLANCGY